MLEETGEFGIGAVDLHGISHTIGGDDREGESSRTGKKRSLHQVGHHGRRSGRVEGKELERMKSASSQPGLDVLVRTST